MFVENPEAEKSTKKIISMDKEIEIVPKATEGKVYCTINRNILLQWQKSYGRHSFTFQEVWG